ncbi:MAG: cytochrome c [Pyrinomonadaceae bacterium]
MRINQVKLFAIILFAVALGAMMIFKSGPAKAAPAADDAAAMYKAKCAACHTATASKFFDTAKTDEVHVAIIMDGKKGEKPPFMPAFKEKGITEDMAKALVAYMKTLRPGVAPTAPTATSSPAPADSPTPATSPSPASSPTPASPPCPPAAPAPTGSPAPAGSPAPMAR